MQSAKIQEKWPNAKKEKQQCRTSTKGYSDCWLLLSNHKHQLQTAVSPK